MKKKKAAKIGRPKKAPKARKQIKISMYLTEDQMSLVSTAHKGYVINLNKQELMVKPLTLGGFILALAQRRLKNYKEGDLK